MAGADANTKLTESTQKTNDSASSVQQKKKTPDSDDESNAPESDDGQDTEGDSDGDVSKRPSAAGWIRLTSLIINPIFTKRFYECKFNETTSAAEILKAWLAFVDKHSFGVTGVNSYSEFFLDEKKKEAKAQCYRRAPLDLMESALKMGNLPSELISQTAKEGKWLHVMRVQFVHSGVMRWTAASTTSHSSPSAVSLAPGAPPAIASEAQATKKNDSAAAKE